MRANRFFSGGGNVFTALFDSALVPLGLILRNAHTHEGADQSADRTANSETWSVTF